MKFSNQYAKAGAAEEFRHPSTDQKQPLQQPFVHLLAFFWGLDLRSERPTYCTERAVSGLSLTGSTTALYEEALRFFPRNVVASETACRLLQVTSVRQLHMAK